jgi:hypothetical protein
MQVQGERLAVPPCFTDEVAFRVAASRSYRYQLLRECAIALGLTMQNGKSRQINK